MRQREPQDFQAAFRKFIGALIGGGFHNGFLAENKQPETRYYWEFMDKYTAFKRSEAQSRDISKKGEIEMTVGWGRGYLGCGDGYRQWKYGVADMLSLSSSSLFEER